MENYKNIVRSIGGKYSSKNTFLHSFQVMQTLYKNEILCDIKLKTDDGKIVNGHKVVLVSASPYFQSMFTSFKESRECVIIKDLDSTALRLLVDFMYTAEIIVTRDNVQVLLHAANFLQINDVQDACCDFLQTRLQPSNGISIMALAELYGCKELLSSSLTFIQQHFSDVVHGSEFLSLSSKEVIKLISSDELTVPSEETVFESVIRWVNHNSDTRKDIFPELMENVRLPLTSNEFLHKRVKGEPLVINSLKCQIYVNEALQFQFLKLQYKIPPPGTMTKSIRTKPRKYTDPSKVILLIREYNFSGLWLDWCDLTTYQWQSWRKINCSVEAESSLVLLKNRYLYSLGCDCDVKVLDLSSQNASWVPSAPMITPQCYPGVAVLDNCIYAVGGCDNDNQELSSAEVFDSNTKEWRMISAMNNRRAELGVGVLNNLLYAVGGLNGSDALKSVECYDPRTDKWNPVADMCSRRYGLSVGVLNGLLYAVGGEDTDQVVLKSVEVYNPSTRIWTYVADMNEPRKNSRVVGFDGLLYVLSGENEESLYLSSVEIYNPVTNTWSMPTASMNFSASRIDAFIVDKSSF